MGVGRRSEKVTCSPQRKPEREQAKCEGCGAEPLRNSQAPPPLFVIHYSTSNQPRPGGVFVVHRSIQRQSHFTQTLAHQPVADLEQ